MHPYAHLSVLLGLTAFAAPALAAQPAVVIELFTSQSCSSCPPADELLGRIKQAEADVLVLDYHVDYWNYLGWRDPYSSADATRRQRDYASLIHGADVYTPQLVVSGRMQVVGSDSAAVQAAIRSAREAADKSAAPIALARDGAGVKVTVGAGGGHGDVLLVGFDDRHVTPIAGGENSGRTLTESNVVRSIRKIGAWSGTEATFTAPSPAGERVAVVLQADDGRIIAAASEGPASGPPA